ncbi:hypothetical protein NQ318_018408, partial [Aromia moschata]
MIRRPISQRQGHKCKIKQRGTDIEEIKEAERKVKILSQRDPTLNSNDDKLRQKLEDMFKIMLVIWCQERRALNITAPLRQGCGDKTRTQKQVCEILNTKYPDRRISQSTILEYRNPHWMMEANTQYPEKVNVWVGIINSQIIGPYFFDGTLTGARYLDFLQNFLVPELRMLFPGDDNPNEIDRNIRDQKKWAAKDDYKETGDSRWAEEGLSILIKTFEIAPRTCLQSLSPTNFQILGNGLEVEFRFSIDRPHWVPAISRAF